MSLDDSTPAPDGADNPGPATTRSGLTGNPLVLVGLALILVIGLVAFLTLRGGDDSEAADCVSETVTLTTAPVMEDLVKAAVKDVNADEPCIDIKVTAGTVKDVVALLADPNAELPEIWIPDSPTWKGQLTAAGWTGTPIADVLAQTPVGLVGGPAAKAPASWAAALDGGSLAMADPSAQGASALALLAPYAEMKSTGETPASIEEKTVPVAQTFGERAVAGGSSETDLTTLSATSTQLVPATEQAYLAARRSNDQLTLVAPATGVPMLQFPLIDVNRGSKDILASGGDLSARVGRAMARWFTSSAGVDAIAEADKLIGRVKGGTGVMDTTLAAYKYAQEKWDPAWFNSVVIFTDGASDDSSSLSLESLVNQLKSIRDPAKPVKVIIIGISKDADTGELDEIAAATGGQNYLVDDPDQILGVLASALLNR